MVPLKGEGNTTKGDGVAMRETTIVSTRPRTTR